VKKTLLGFWKLWNSNCDSTLYQLQLANAHTKHYSYSSARKKLVVFNGGGF